MSETDGSKLTVPGGFDSWRAYWQAQGMPWRMEPEIDEDRQRFLAARRIIVPSLDDKVFPFGGVKLRRADVEWLLATHTSRGISGPVQWDGEKNKPEDQRREGLDLRGADLAGEWLASLPLACMRGGLSHEEGRYALSPVGETPLLGEAALVSLEGAYLIRTELQGAILGSARLRNADLFGAHMQAAYLWDAQMQGARLTDAELHGAVLAGARMQGVHATAVQLQGALLESTYLQGAYLYEANLTGADLVGARTDVDTFLANATLDSQTRLADVVWNGVPITRLNWQDVVMLGDEYVARQPVGANNKKKDAATRAWEFQNAAMANRQVAVVLRDQGLDEHASRFAYRAQVCHRRLLRLQHRWGRWSLQTLLALLAGYGFRLGRIFGAYVIVLITFATIYFLLGLPNTGRGFTLDALRDAILVSLTAIHGRVFLEQLGQYSVQAWVAAVESVVGIVIEGVFVAVLVQRFFGGR